MCQADGCGNKGGYGKAYAGSEGVLLRVRMSCPKCSAPIKVESIVHMGGEQWEPFVGCSCGWGEVITVKPVTYFLAQKKS